MDINQTRTFYQCLSQCVSQTYALLYLAYSSSAPFYIIPDVTYYCLFYYLELDKTVIQTIQIHVPVLKNKL